MKFSFSYFLLLLIPTFHLFFFQLKIFNIKNPTSCLIAFKSNNFLGLVIFLIILIVKIL